jgi:hypothetical protein
VYGAVAFISEDSGTTAMAEKNGLFLMQAMGDGASIVNTKGFVPKAGYYVFILFFHLIKEFFTFFYLKASIEKLRFFCKMQIKFQSQGIMISTGDTLAEWVGMAPIVFQSVGKTSDSKQNETRFGLCKMDIVTNCSCSSKMQMQFVGYVLRKKKETHWERESPVYSVANEQSDRMILNIQNAETDHLKRSVEHLIKLLLS